MLNLSIVFSAREPSLSFGRLIGAFKAGKFLFLSGIKRAVLPLMGAKYARSMLICLYNIFI
jgi:hypothetical protein